MCAKNECILFENVFVVAECGRIFLVVRGVGDDDDCVLVGIGCDWVCVL